MQEIGVKVLIRSSVWCCVTSSGSLLLLMSDVLLIVLGPLGQPVLLRRVIRRKDSGHKRRIIKQRSGEIER